MKKKSLSKFRILFIRTLMVSSFSLIFLPDISGQQYTLASGTYNNSIPLASSSNNRREYIYYPSNFPTAPSGYITKIYIQASASVSTSFTDFTVRMGPTTLNTFVTGPWITAGINTVFYSPTFDVSTITGNWIPITLQTPFYYNNTTNFIVDVSQLGYTTGVLVRNSSVTDRSLYGGASNASASASNRLANFGFDMTPLGTDAGILSIINPNDTICSGNDTVSVRLKNYGPNSLSTVAVDWKVNNVSQTAYNWSGTLASGDSTDINIGSYNFLTATTYNIVAYTTNPNGIADTVNTNDTINKTAIFVNPTPTSSVIPAGPINICQNDSVILTASSGIGLTYQWKKDGLPLSGETDTSLTVKQAGSYVVVVTNATTCSTTSNSVVVTLISAPVATATAQGATTFCSGDSVLILANTGTGLTYQWKKDVVNINGATLSSYNVTQTGAYKVVVTNSNSCVDSSSAIAVTVNPKPTATLTAAGQTTFCSGDSVVLEANTGTGFTYGWINNGTLIAGAMDSIYTAKTSGSYQVVIVNSFMCLDSSLAIAVVVKPLPVVNLGNDTTVKKSKTLTLDAGSGFSSYTWSTGSTTQTHLVDGTTLGAGIFTFYVDVIDNYQCSNSDTIIITITDDTGVNELLSNSIKIYPNPAKDILNIRTTENIESVKIYNAFGCLLANEIVGNKHAIINTTDFTPGMYFVQISTEIGFVTRKFNVVE